VISNTTNAKYLTGALDNKMEKFRLRKNSNRLSVIFIAFMVLATICFYHCRAMLKTGDIRADMLIALGSIFTFLSLYIPYKVFIIPKISITDDVLQFGQVDYDLTSIEILMLTARRDALIKSSLNCIKIHFKEGNILIIDDWKYSNISQFKIILNSIYNADALQDVEEIKFDITPALSYKGSFLWSYWGIFLIVMQVSMWIIWFNATANRTVASIVGTTIAVYAYTSLQVYYVVLSSNEIMIKNYLLPWKKNAHKLSKISEISINSNFRMADSITIINKEYKSRTYYAGTIRRHEWRKLKRKFTELQIPVTGNQII
jgi:hypothetical protein